MTEPRSHPSPIPLDEATALMRVDQLQLLKRLCKRLLSRKWMLWKSLAGLTNAKLDIVDVEQTVDALYRAGWLERIERAQRDGDRRVVRIRLRQESVEDAYELLQTASPSARAKTLAKLVQALQGLSGAPPIPERVLVHRVFGDTKKVRLRDHRHELERALGCRLEERVRFHVDLVLTAGPATYSWAGHRVDLRASAPFYAIPEPVALTLADVQLDTQRLVCVENQTVFESLLYEGLAQDAVVLFTSGYLGGAQRAWVRALVAAGVRQVDHWGDLDPWGLDIYRDLRDLVSGLDDQVHVRPWRMEPGPLERKDARKLTPQDWVKLHQYLRRPDAPLRETALEMLRLGRKLEQEALLNHPGTPTLEGAKR